MIALAKLALLALVAIMCLALTAEARELLDYYDDCYNGAWYLSSHTFADSPRAWLFAASLPNLSSLVFRTLESACIGVNLA